MNKRLSAAASEFVPQKASSNAIYTVPPTPNIQQSINKPKKTKDQRACPRKRRKNKNKNNFNESYVVSYYPDLLNRSGFDDILSDKSDELTIGSQSTTSTSISGFIKSVMSPDNLSYIHELSSLPMPLSEYENNINDNDLRRVGSPMIMFESIGSSPSPTRPLYSQDQIDSWNTWFNHMITSSYVKDKTNYGETNETEHEDSVDSSWTSIIRQNSNMTEVEQDWIEMQNKWRFSKQIMYDNELENEIIERKKWSNWAIHAAEVERQRRIQVLREMDEKSEKERKARAAWAVNAIELERNERLYHQFLMSLTSTNWFNDAISSTIVTTDYELVCPYYKLGCTAVCRRSSVSKHLEECVYALDCNHSSTLLAVEHFDVVCPNSVLGCVFVGGRQEVMTHLQSCSYSHGVSKEQEDKERLQLKNHVILECEEERLRRVADPAGGSVSGLTSQGTVTGLHNLLRSQIVEVLSQLHDRVEDVNTHINLMQEKRRPVLESVISKLQGFITRLWSSATLEVYGSYSAGLQGSHSDLDLVVCFSDEYQSLSKISGSFPLLHILANFLQREAVGFLSIKTVILTARVPVIKAVAMVAIPSAEGTTNHSVAVDISIDSPAHTGLATAEMIRTLTTALPPLRPIVMILKEYLKSHDLTDTYHGGISSYGITLLALIPMLKRTKRQDYPEYHGSNEEIKSTVSITSAPNSPKRSRTLSLSSNISSSSSIRASTPTKQAIQGSDESNAVLPDQSLNRVKTKEADATSVEVITPLPGASSYPRIESQQKRLPNKRQDNITSNGKGNTGPDKYYYDVHKSPPSLALEGRLHHIQTSIPKDVLKRQLDKPFHWTNIRIQKAYGRQIALKLLGLDNLSCNHCTNASDPTCEHYESDSKGSNCEGKGDIPCNRSLSFPEIPDSSQSNPSEDIKSISQDKLLRGRSTDSNGTVNDPVVPVLLPITKPLLGELLEEILNEYGGEMQCGVHGFSVRNGGFRFEVSAKNNSHPSSDTVALSHVMSDHADKSIITNPVSMVNHPQAGDPIVIEDPINVINNVGAGCYKALAIQRVLLEAHERLKSIAVRCNSPRGTFVPNSSFSPSSSSPNSLSNSRPPSVSINSRNNSIEGSRSSSIDKISSFPIIDVGDDSERDSSVHFRNRINIGKSNSRPSSMKLRSISNNSEKLSDRMDKNETMPTQRSLSADLPRSICRNYLSDYDAHVEAAKNEQSKPDHPFAISNQQSDRSLIDQSEESDRAVDIDPLKEVEAIAIDPSSYVQETDKFIEKYEQLERLHIPSKTAGQGDENSRNLINRNAAASLLPIDLLEEIFNFDTKTLVS